VTGPLSGRIVIVTRPRASSARLAVALRVRGAKVVFAPLIRTVPPRSWKALDSALRRLSRFDAVIFASANAVAAFFDRSRKVLKGRPAAPRVVGAVGPATAAAAAARGWKASVVPEVRRAEGLARALRLPRGARVLIPRAEGGREALPRLLRAAGARVTTVSAYRTLPDAAGRAALRAALAAGADAACFASGSAVAALDAPGLRRAFRGCAAVAIGPVTAAALRARGFKPVVARAAGDRELADAAVRALGRRR
jgi:uroporphyrinogen-III synthase